MQRSVGIVNPWASPPAPARPRMTPEAARVVRSPGDRHPAWQLPRLQLGVRYARGDRRDVLLREERRQTVRLVEERVERVEDARDQPVFGVRVTKRSTGWSAARKCPTVP